MDIELRPATDDERAAWLANLRVSYLEDRIAAGDDPADAAVRTEATFAESLPDGRPIAGHHVLRVVADGEGVGTLWVGPLAATVPDRWWVLDIVIDEAARGRGVGRRTMELAEQLARDHGAVAIGLNVFARNHAARALYESMGYEPTATQMRKDL